MLFSGGTPGQQAPTSGSHPYRPLPPLAPRIDRQDHVEDAHGHLAKTRCDSGHAPRLWGKVQFSRLWEPTGTLLFWAVALFGNVSRHLMGWCPAYDGVGRCENQSLDHRGKVILTTCCPPPPNLFVSSSNGPRKSFYVKSMSLRMEQRPTQSQSCCAPIFCATLSCTFT